jgi:hypothetical protein
VARSSDFDGDSPEPPSSLFSTVEEADMSNHQSSYQNQRNSSPPVFNRGDPAGADSSMASNSTIHSPVPNRSFNTDLATEMNEMSQAVNNIGLGRGHQNGPHRGNNSNPPNGPRMTSNLQGGPHRSFNSAQGYGNMPGLGFHASQVTHNQPSTSNNSRMTTIHFPNRQSQSQTQGPNQGQAQKQGLESKVLSPSLS